MGILGIMVWIYDLMKPFQDEEATNTVRRKQIQRGEEAEKMTYRSTSPSILEQKPQIHGVAFSTPLRTQPAFVLPSYNPETPLPPTLSLEEAQRRLAEGGSNSSTFLNSQYHLLARAEKTTPVAATSLS